MTIIESIQRSPWFWIVSLTLVRLIFLQKQLKTMRIGVIAIDLTTSTFFKHWIRMEAGIMKAMAAPKGRDKIDSLDFFRISTLVAPQISSEKLKRCSSANTRSSNRKIRMLFRGHFVLVTFGCPDA